MYKLTHRQIEHFFYETLKGFMGTSKTSLDRYNSFSIRILMKVKKSVFSFLYESNTDLEFLISPGVKDFYLSLDL